jgi:hypothetical protein
MSEERKPLRWNPLTRSLSLMLGCEPGGNQRRGEVPDHAGEPP